MIRFLVVWLVQNWSWPAPYSVVLSALKLSHHGLPFLDPKAEGELPAKSTKKPNCHTPLQQRVQVRQGQLLK